MGRSCCPHQQQEDLASHKVSLEIGHQSQALRSLQLWLVSWLQPRDQKQSQGQKRSHRQPSGCTLFPAHRNGITVKVVISSAYDCFIFTAPVCRYDMYCMYMCLQTYMYVSVCACVGQRLMSRVLSQSAFHAVS